LGSLNKAPVKIDLEQIRELASVVTETEITELSIETGDQKITIKKSAAPMQARVELTTPPPTAACQAPPAQTASASAQAAPTEAKLDESKFTAITSPMVGTFYRSPSPESPAFISVGDRVSIGQTVCIIEAMKLMNDLPSEVAGKLVKICVENGTTIEYGQTLFLLDPTG
jgi:acetyl-CoA carboxylase biotin carboxyl carrier protein